MTTDFIAEISSNHNSDLDRMKLFIKTAKDIGCTGVKFQLFKLNELFSKEILSKSKDHQKRINWELDENLIPELSDYSKKLKLKFGCTPFYLDAVNILDPYVDFFKIASYELLWKELFIKCGNTGKPIVISTGMANIQEVIDAVKCLQKTKCSELTILHCNSAYPTPIKDANLSSILSLKENLESNTNKDFFNNIKFGYSDHTVSKAVIYRAVLKYDLNFVEFHLDIDGKGEEFSAGHCWLPEQIKHVITEINEGAFSEGDGVFSPSISESKDRDWRADPSDGLRPTLKIRKKY